MTTRMVLLFGSTGNGSPSSAEPTAILKATFLRCSVDDRRILYEPSSGSGIEIFIIGHSESNSVSTDDWPYTTSAVRRSSLHDWIPIWSADTLRFRVYCTACKQLTFLASNL